MEKSIPETSIFYGDNLDILQQKARYLVLGGLGFIGKNLCEALIELDCFETLVIVDKKMLKLNSHMPKSKYSLYEKENIKLL